MMDKPSARHIQFEAVFNFRDLGGYRTKGGHQVAWHRLYRSGELYFVTANDLARLRKEVRLACVLDLRNGEELKHRGDWRLKEVGVRYFNVPFAVAGEDVNDQLAVFRGFSNMGEVYLYFVRHPEYGRRVAEAVSILARQGSRPLVFHCSAGKHRTGILSALILSSLGVSDEQVILDYTLTAAHMKEHLSRVTKDPAGAAFIDALPAYMHESAPESMALFLSTLKQEYGSARSYLEAHGAEASLFDRLESALLV